MNEKGVLKKIEEMGSKLPHFDDGRINYSGSDYAPVIMAFVEYGGKILLLKRSDKVRTYKGKWNGVGGYLDEVCPVREKVLEELREELGVGEDTISAIYIGNAREETDDSIGKTWLIVPVLVKLKRKPQIRIDWEHTEYKWVSPVEIKGYDIVSGLESTLTAALTAASK